MNLEHCLVFFQREEKSPIKVNLPNDYTKIIAVDGGLNDVISLGLKADIFVGDCDSVNVELKNLNDIFIYAKEKDFLDGEGALEYLKSQKFKKLTFYSFFQGRWDMSFTHFLSLVHYKDFANHLEIQTNKSKIFYFTKSFQLKGKVNQKFSIIPLENISNLSISGAKYNLEPRDVELGRGLCLSNEFQKSFIDVKWENGEALLIEIFN
ncbi:MAG: thiamine diphosphokinase [Candidatus Cloacimonadota bacterium]|nr:MAG: thiamine diphosphokinase [Candidatus Cloacimonadota bacterium]